MEWTGSCGTRGAVGLWVTRLDASERSSHGHEEEDGRDDAGELTRRSEQIQQGGFSNPVGFDFTRLKGTCTCTCTNHRNRSIEYHRG